MQTFLPYADFKKTFEVLDNKRLGKQRLEALQLIKAILGMPKEDGTPYKGWLNHPCTVMWRNFPDALKLYYNLCIEEWIKRSFKNTMKKFDLDEATIIMPDWLGFEKFHLSHRSVLLFKDFEYYSQFNWGLNPSNVYVWRDNEKKWYKYIRDEKRREYFVS